ncbi:hypothetical protein AMJ57_04725 [Parcubacteria bacterium SG8_24]|nr:MAG: hypothetical protein AMJ57_04725 [Parcubacteria bacterium SG8_24]
MTYADREEAGRRLAAALEDYRGAADTIVVALPRGGVVLGRVIADELGLPLDIVVPRKVGAPDNEEFAVGALAESGEVVWSEGDVARFDRDELERTVERERVEAQRRLETYRVGLPERVLRGKTVLLVDDGIATGLTMSAAVRTVRQEKAARIVMAVPVAAPDSARRIAREVDRSVILETPRFFAAVGQFYERFDQVTDEEVITLLKR